MIRLSHLLVMLVVCVLSSSNAAAADPKKISELSLFVVNVEGKRTRGGETVYSKGRAFAIGPETLITAGHVTGNQTTWANENTSGLFYKPIRSMEIKAVRKHGNPAVFHGTSKMFVTPAQVEMVDAVRLTAPKFDVEMLGSGLSTCPVDSQIKYRALILQNGDLEKPRFVELTPDSNQTTDLNGAFRFYNERYLGSLSKIGTGDSGSPILDGKNQVIGLVSAIEKNGEEIYVTLVSSFLDLIPSQTPVDCAERVGPKDVRALKDELQRAQKRIDELEAHNAVLTKASIFFADLDEGLIQKIAEMMPSMTEIFDNEKFDHEKMAPHKVYDRLENLRSNVISMQDNLLDWEVKFDPSTRTFQISYKKLVESKRHVEFIDLEAVVTNSEGKKALASVFDLRVLTKDNLSGVFESKASDGLAEKIKKVTGDGFRPGSKISSVKVVVTPKIEGKSKTSKLIEQHVDNYEQ